LILAAAAILGGFSCPVAVRAQDDVGAPLGPGPDPFADVNTTFTLDSIAPGLLAAGGALDASTPDMVIGLRGGVEVSPAYLGSDQMSFGPDAAARFDYIRFSNGFEFGSGQTVGFRTGFGLRGSARYIGRRDSDDHSEIAGLDDVDPSLELGLGLGYEQRNYRVFADVRYAFIGYNGWVGEIGADGIAYPLQGLTLTLGPRLSLGDTHFVDTYFGISAEESLRSGLPEYDPDGGVTGAGVTLGARYLLNERWGVEGAAEYERLLNDAADSPITEQGSANQYTVRVGITRRISLDF
jgi:outer membrane scaffolding protein for murein synthesis (MipA/OmpV family)